MNSHRMHPLVWAASVALLLCGCASLRPGAAQHGPLTARVVRISDEYANINTNLDAKGLATAGIVQGSTFRAHFGSQSIEVFYGEDYGDVARGEWVGLIDEGALQIAISFGNAATVLDCAVGDEFLIVPIARSLSE